jgi:hypothetical protein
MRHDCHQTAENSTLKEKKGLSAIRMKERPEAGKAISREESELREEAGQKSWASVFRRIIAYSF